MKSKFSIFCIMLAAGASAVVAQVDSSLPLIASFKVAVVETEAGKVQGFIHRGIYAYRGIPYANAARFMPPQKVNKWEGVLTALTYGYICPQKQTEQPNDEMEFLGPHRFWIANENCQNLNIWIPGIRDGKKRPVMVWLYGGGFTTGSSIEQPAYDGENLARRGDVVIVSVNHRLNILGFLDLSAYGSQYKTTGNLGIMDIVAALQWVNDNIDSFGGDPSNVTMFGQSGGGGKVTTVMATSAAKGLFQKANLESGAARKLGITLMSQKTSRRIAEPTLQNLHLDGSQVDQLQKISGSERESGRPPVFAGLSRYRHSGSAEVEHG